ncbi:hypothetical protein BVX98_06025 [bacterium F11]|nr:hypothetical protein BVX98_06025 [bacterium F11]
MKLINLITLSSLIILFQFCFSSFLFGAIDGPAIINNDYKIDLTRGPIIGSNRKVALGGAYVALAEGAGALGDNPAGAAIRPPHSNAKWNWDATIGTIKIRENDFDNNGSDTFDYSDNRVTNVGVLLQVNRFGLGFYSTPQDFEIRGLQTTNQYNFETGYLALGYQTKNEQWTWGFGGRFTSMAIDRGESGSQRLIKLSGIGTHMGLIWNPNMGPFQFGASFSSKISASQSLVKAGTEPVQVSGLIVPDEVILPAEGSVGFLYSLESAPFWEGHPFLVSMDIKILDKSHQAYGIESFFEQKVQESGKKITVRYHLGSELEVLKNVLRLRLGTYHEPSRFQGVSSRQHLTGGFESRLFRFQFFGERYMSFRYAFDVARDYLNHSISFGLWNF